jgi:CheY-like chemotaxis protein
MDGEEMASRVRQRGPWGSLVLVIDDLPEARGLYRTFLELRGFRTREADDGPSGLGMAVRLRPAAIVLDFSMPRMDGAEVVKRLKADERTRRIPIVMLTALRDAVDAGTQTELAAFLDKPCDPEAFVDAVMGVLSTGEAISALG